jgi:quinolinate synthase
MNDLFDKIKELKARRNAVILAHNYTLPEVQDCADFTGDSLALSVEAKKVSAPVILFCGVRFMAETAKILSPGATVLMPEPDAGCPMADMANPEEIREFKRNNPDTLLIAYINTTAATKALVDICCTSANADKVLRSIPPEQKVMFLPDRNLGQNTAANCLRTMEYWNGFCPIHDRITVEDVRRSRALHPAAKVLVHPECRPEVVAEADKALSTGGMIAYVRDSADTEFIAGTEIGILHRLTLDNPGKHFYPLTAMPT